MDAQRLWFSREPVAVIARVLLLPFSALYWLGWMTYLGIYNLGLKRAKAPHAPIVVIGNFTVGGSGKTPAIMATAASLVASGRQVVIGCSGYGSAHEADAAIAPEGPLDPAEWGDEPALLRARLPDIPLIIGRDRVQAAALCNAHYADAALLMDDGLQHLPLATNVKIALDSPQRNRFVLPAGPYREPRNRRRVNLIIPGDFELSRQSHFTDAEGGEVIIQGVLIQALTAIGSPDRFFDDLRNRGATLTFTKALADHDPLTTGTLWEGFDSARPIVVTEKDWVKLRNRADIAQWTIWIAVESAAIEPAETFSFWLNGKIKEAMAP